MSERTKSLPEHSSELQETELGKKIDELNNAIEPYSKSILFGIVVLAAAVIGVVLYQSGESNKRSAATLELIEAVGSGDPERLQRVVGTFPDTIASGWAAVFRGDETLASGIAQLYRDREAGLSEIETAESAYRQAKSIGGDALLISRSNLGLAKAAESKGEFEAAIAAYREVIAAGESHQMREYAEKRINILEKPQTQAFLTWFNEQDFSPADPSLPPSLPGMSSLPGLPDLDLPELTLPGSDPADTEATTEGEMDESAQASGGPTAEESAAESAAKPIENAAKPTENAAEPTENAAEPTGEAEAESAEESE